MNFILCISVGKVVVNAVDEILGLHSWFYYD